LVTGAVPVDMLKKLGPQVFWPKPNVDSGIVSILPDLERQAKIIDREFFHELVRGVFTHRRKHLRVGLSNHFRDLPKTKIDEAIQQLGLQPDARAEQLEPDAFVTLANRFRELIS